MENLADTSAPQVPPIEQKDHKIQFSSEVTAKFSIQANCLAFYSKKPLNIIYEIYVNIEEV